MTSVVSQQSIALYAELLSNLRQLSVVASLPSKPDSTTSASLSKDGRVLTVRHQGETQDLQLPEQPLPSILQIPPQTADHVAWRLRLPPQDGSPDRFSLEDQPLPWNALDILKRSPITCRACGESLVKDGQITEWKDLPSDNWAEMMEFWHCHKPVDHGNPPEGTESDGTATKKGYGANNVISAQQGVGLVDVTSLVLFKADCSAVMFCTTNSNIESDIDTLKVEDDESARFLQVSCNACLAEVGIYNLATEAVSLFKWSIGCETAVKGPAPNVTECLAASLMAAISRSGSAKSIIAPHLIGGRKERPTGQQSLYVWVLNPNVVYATSQSADCPKTPAMKLLFRSLPAEEGNAVVDAMNSDVQELTLPDAGIKAVTRALEASNHLLPHRERLFKEWKVGLLHRWKPNKDP